MFINYAGKALLIHKHEVGFQHQYILFCFVDMLLYCAYMYNWGCRGHDRMVVRFITTYAISAYHH